MTNSKITGVMIRLEKQTKKLMNRVGRLWHFLLNPIIVVPIIKQDIISNYIHVKELTYNIPITLPENISNYINEKKLKENINTNQPVDTINQTKTEQDLWCLFIQYIK